MENLSPTYLIATPLLLAVVLVCTGFGLRWLWRYSPGNAATSAKGVARLGVPVKYLKAFSAPVVPVTARSFLTPNELEFWGRLRQALPHLIVAPQVAMGALVDSARPRDWETIKLFQGKVCDFALLDAKSGKPVAIVELDDVTHDAERDFERDTVLASVGLPTIRFHSRAKPSQEDIRAALALVKA